MSNYVLAVIKTVAHVAAVTVVMIVITHFRGVPLETGTVAIALCGTLLIRRYEGR